MKKDIAKKWIKALISNKYKQGTGTLKQYNSKGEAQHCCLGVLCELYNKDMKKNKKKTLPENIYDNDCNFSHGYAKFGNRKEDLPKEVREWSGMKTSLGKFAFKSKDYTGEYSDTECLADLNDSGRKFKTIAKIIDKNWENL